MDSVKKVPEIRFDGFENEGNSLQLKDLGKKYTSLTGKSKKDFGHGNGRYITFSNVLANPVSSIDGVDKIEIDNSQNAVKFGDLFFNISSETYDEVGMSSVWTHDVENYYLNSFCMGFRPSVKIDNYFITYLLRSRSARKQIMKLAQGISRINISQTKMMDILLQIPSIEEQAQIGNFFKNIDEKLEIEKEKHQKLVNFKKAMLDDMFPKEGEKVPKVRFEGFDDEWSISKLGDLGEISSSGVDKKLYPDEKAVYLLNYMDVYNKKQPSKENINEFMITSANEHELVSKSVKKGDVFFTPTSETSDDIGHSMAIYNTVENLVYSYHILRFRPFDNGLDVSFSNYFANIDPVRKQLVTNCQGAQRMTLKLEEFKNLIVSLPSLEEQALIGDFFKNLDEKIELSEKKIVKIENFKKAMLDKMFV